MRELNKKPSIVNVGKYLKFSNATVSGENVLSVDIKDLEVEVKPLDNTVFIPGVHDKVYLDLNDTRLDALLNKMEELSILDNTDKLLQKLVSFFNRNNVEFIIKAGKKPAAPVTAKRKPDTNAGGDSNSK